MSAADGMMADTPSLSAGLRDALAAANNLLVAASTAEHCRQPESTLREYVEELRDSCLAYLGGYAHDT